MIKRNFKGVWITKEIWLHKELNAIEKILLTEISSLDNDKGCYASNRYFADFFQIGTRQVSRYVSSLRDKNFISVIVENKTERTIKVIKNRVPTTEVSKVLPTTEVSMGGTTEVSKEVRPKCLHNNTISNKETNTLIGADAQDIKKPLVKKVEPIKKTRKLLGYTPTEINATIFLLQDLNPNWQSWYKPGPHRASVAKVLKFAKESNIEIPTLVKKALELRGQEYGVQIFSPCEMAEKFAKLITTKKKESNIKSYDKRDPSRYINQKEALVIKV